MNYQYENDHKSRFFMSPLQVSIIICTKNRSEDLELTLKSVFSQTHFPDSLVLVDDSDGETARMILEKFCRESPVCGIYVHSYPANNGLPAARNRGIQKVPSLRGIILFLDDDVTLEENYLRTLLELFERNPDVVGATGFIRNKYHDRSFPLKLLFLITGCIIPALIPVSLFGPRVTWTAEALYPLYRKPRADAVPAQWLSGCNMAYRSTVFIEGFTFDEHLVRYAQGEDVLFSHRLYRVGKKLLLSYNAHLTHRISVDSRISPFRKLAMIFGYRNYEISRFIPSRLSGSFLYTVFVIQFIISIVIISVSNKKGLAPVTEVIRAYGMTREFEQEIKSGYLERFNDFLSTLP
jgi:GT2 family glycosyltransferase